MRIAVDRENFRILGRTDHENGALVLSYSGSEVGFRFTGKRISFTMETKFSRDQDYKGAYAVVYVNGGSAPVKRFHVSDRIEKTEIYAGDTCEETEIRFVKITEAAYGSIFIYDAEADGDVSPLPENSRKIEFIGDSITCGFGVEGGPDDPFKLEQENYTSTFAAITAAELEADASIVAWSGIGVYSSYVDESINVPSQAWLMPYIYPYTMPGRYKAAYNSTEVNAQWKKWDFSSNRPDVIVMYLGTNDSSYTRGKQSRIARFKHAYTEFLKEIRAYNPDSEILCLCGAMTGKLTAATCNAVMEAAETDKKLHVFRMPLQDSEHGIGALGHPNEYTQRKMAELLTAELKNIMNW